jgi:hypothetical protein
LQSPRAAAPRASALAAHAHAQQGAMSAATASGGGAAPCAFALRPRTCAVFATTRLHAPAPRTRNANGAASASCAALLWRVCVQPRTVCRQQRRLSRSDEAAAAPHCARSRQTPAWWPSVAARQSCRACAAGA